MGDIVPGNEFYDYSDKYLQDTAQLIAPAELRPDVTERLRELAVRAFEAIGGAGLARVDFLVEGEEGVYVNEINTLPGFTSISMYPRLWGLSGVPLPQLVDRLVQIAESSLVQTETVFRQTKLSRQVGDKSEFDLLRAQVTRDNQRPLVIHLLLQSGLEVTEAGDPRLGVLAHPPVVDQADGHGIQEVELLPAPPPGDDEARRFELLEVLHDSEARHREVLLERVERLTVLPEQIVEEAPPSGVGQGPEHLVHDPRICD